MGRTPKGYSPNATAPAGLGGLSNHGYGNWHLTAPPPQDHPDHASTNRRKATRKEAKKTKKQQSTTFADASFPRHNASHAYPENASRRRQEHHTNYSTATTENGSEAELIQLQTYRPVMSSDNETLRTRRTRSSQRTTVSSHFDQLRLRSIDAMECPVDDVSDDPDTESFSTYDDEDLYCFPRHYFRNKLSRMLRAFKSALTTRREESYTIHPRDPSHHGSEQDNRERRAEEFHQSLMLYHHRQSSSFQQQKTTEFIAAPNCGPPMDSNLPAPNLNPKNGESLAEQTETTIYDAHMCYSPAAKKKNQNNLFGGKKKAPGGCKVNKKPAKSSNKASKASRFPEIPIDLEIVHEEAARRQHQRRVMLMMSHHRNPGACHQHPMMMQQDGLLQVDVNSIKRRLGEGRMC